MAINMDTKEQHKLLKELKESLQQTAPHSGRCPHGYFQPGAGQICHYAGPLCPHCNRAIPLPDPYPMPRPRTPRRIVIEF